MKMYFSWRNYKKMSSYKLANAIILFQYLHFKNVFKTRILFVHD